jgi:putative oxidoreductase
MSVALLLARLFFGLGIAAHGAQKLFGWFGGYGIAGTGGFFEKLGFRPGRLFAFAAGAGELGGGLLVVLGLLGPVGPALLIVVTVVAAVSVHLHNGFFTAKNGVETPLLYAFAALLLAYTGSGRFSLDAMFGLSGLSNARTATIAIVTAIVVAGLNLLARRRAPALAEAAV